MAKGKSHHSGFGDKAKPTTTKQNRIAALERHLKLQPNDTIAQSSLDKIKSGGKTDRRNGYKKKGSSGAGNRITAFEAIANRLERNRSKMEDLNFKQMFKAFAG